MRGHSEGLVTQSVYRGQGGPAQNFLIRSNDRVSGTPANFILNLNQALQEGYYSLEFVYIPNTFFNVAAVNRTIYFMEDSTNKTATIDVGNYSPYTLAPALATALTNTSDGYNTYTCSYNSITMGFTITAQENFVFQYGTFVGTNANANARLLGFTPGTDTSSGTTLTSVNPADLSYPAVAMITIDNNQSIVTGGSTSFSGGTYVVSVDVNTGAILYWYKSTAFDQVAFIKATSQPRIVITDADGNSLDLRGIDWSLLIRRVDDNARVGSGVQFPIERLGHTVPLPFSNVPVEQYADRVKNRGGGAHEERTLSSRGTQDINFFKTNLLS